MTAAALGWCTRVEPVVRGFIVVKFEDDPEKKKVPLKAYEQCAEPATHEHDLGDGCIAYRCEKHRVKP